MTAPATSDAPATPTRRRRRLPEWGLGYLFPSAITPASFPFALTTPLRACTRRRIAHAGRREGEGMTEVEWLACDDPTPELQPYR